MTPFKNAASKLELEIVAPLHDLAKALFGLLIQGIALETANTTVNTSGVSAAADSLPN